MSIFKTAGLPGAQVPVSQIAAPAADLLTLEAVAAAVPPHLKSAITQNLVDQVNNVAGDPLFAEQVRNNFIGYTAVMKEGKFKIEDYLHAVVFVSYKLMGYSNKESYCRTFPARHQQLLAKGTSDKDISAYVAAYARGKLVNLILEQSLVPTWVLNQHIYQEAINTQAELMRSAISEKVRSDAADSLLNHLKKPEGKDFQINMDMRETSGITELKQALKDMAEAQQAALQGGAGIKTVTEAPLIDARAREVEDDDGAH
jgi:hypothetical protein